MEWLWPVLVSSGLTGVATAIAFAFAASRQISDLRTEIRVLTARFDGWDRRCDDRHRPLEESDRDAKGRLNNHAERIRVIENQYGIKGREMD